MAHRTLSDLVLPLERYLGRDELLRQACRPADMFTEEIEHVIPSINICGGGLALVGLFLVSQSLVCDVRIVGPRHHSFDFCRKRNIANYRFNEGLVEIKEEDVVKAAFNTAEIFVIFNELPSLPCQFRFAGTAEELAEWRADLLKAIPAFGLKSIVTR